MLRLMAGLIFAALLILNPTGALDAARQALGVWAASFVPALLPFFAVTPALSSDEAAALYSRLLGRPFGALFGCPGHLAGAALIGLMGGQPCSGHRRRAVARSGDGRAADRRRAACLRRQPWFRSARWARRCWGTQIWARSSSGRCWARWALAADPAARLLRRPRRPDALTARPADRLGVAAWRTSWERPADRLGVMRSASRLRVARQADKLGAALMRGAFMLSVGAHMVVFAVAARLIAGFLPPGWEAGVLSAMEVSGGCAAIADLPLRRRSG